MNIRHTTLHSHVTIAALVQPVLRLQRPSISDDTQLNHILLLLLCSVADAVVALLASGFEAPVGSNAPLRLGLPCNTT
jgi:hypothetical protein